MMVKLVLIGHLLNTLAFSGWVLGNGVVTSGGLFWVAVANFVLAALILQKVLRSAKVVPEEADTEALTAKRLEAQERNLQLRTEIDTLRHTARGLRESLTNLLSNEEDLRRRIQNTRRRIDYHTRRNPDLPDKAPAVEGEHPGALDHILEDDD